MSRIALPLLASSLVFASWAWAAEPNAGRSASERKPAVQPASAQGEPVPVIKGEPRQPIVAVWREDWGLSSSWHELAEQNPGTVAASSGLTSSRGKSREEFLKTDDKNYLKYRALWGKMRTDVASLIPKTGERRDLSFEMRAFREHQEDRQEKAVAEIKELGGKVTIDEKSPGKPVVGADASGDAKQKEVESQSGVGEQREEPRTLAPTSADRLDEVLCWLPADTETIMGGNGPFTLADAPKKALCFLVAFWAFMAGWSAIGLLAYRRESLAVEDERIIQTGVFRTRSMDFGEITDVHWRTIRGYAGSVALRSASQTIKVKLDSF